MGMDSDAFRKDADHADPPTPAVRTLLVAGYAMVVVCFADNHGGGSANVA